MKAATTRSSKKTKKKVVLWGVTALFIAASLALTQDIIITNILAYRICNAEPHPKTFIKKTVEYPESIYWEDNIYPGFDEKDRLLMIRNYLDGEHLKTMALNAPDGTIYLFTATSDDWKNSRDIKAGKGPGNYYDAIEEEARAIAERGTTTSKELMPILNYSVTFNIIELTGFERKYLYSDEVIIKENNTKEVIAYTRRLMRRWYMLMPDVSIGNRYYYPEAMCGYPVVSGFGYEVFLYFTEINSGAVMETYNSKLFRKFNKTGGE